MCIPPHARRVLPLLAVRLLLLALALEATVIEAAATLKELPLDGWPQPIELLAVPAFRQAPEAFGRSR